MATFRIPPVLRDLTGGEVSVEASGATLADALEALFAAHPALRGRLVDGDGGIPRFVNVYVDDEDVRPRDGLATPLRDTSTVIILPAMAGG